MYQVRHVAGSWQGEDRGENKDRDFVLGRNDQMLFVLFDGVSSSPRANESIDVAVRVLEEGFGSTPVPKLLEGANDEILATNSGEGASTYVALSIDSEKEMVHISSLGDSRVYEVGSEAYVQITRDDSPPDEPHVITRGLGFFEMKEEYFRKLV